MKRNQNINEIFPNSYEKRLRNKNKKKIAKERKVIPDPIDDRKTQFIWRGQGYDCKCDFISNTKYNFQEPIFKGLSKEN